MFYFHELLSTVTTFDKKGKTVFFSLFLFLFLSFFPMANFVLGNIIYIYIYIYIKKEEKGGEMELFSRYFLENLLGFCCGKRIILIKSGRININSSFPLSTTSFRGYAIFFSLSLSLSRRNFARFNFSRIIHLRALEFVKT